jgi:hypothetical protein
MTYDMIRYGEGVRTLDKAVPDPRILYQGPTRRCAISFTLLTPYPLQNKRRIGTHEIGQWVDPEEQTHILCHWQDSKPRFSGCPARRLLIMRLLRGICHTWWIEYTHL